MNDPLQPFFDGPGFVVLDGALATELEYRGADLKDPLWSARILLERPELIRQVHFDYFMAGADVAITASYQATFEGFARRGIGRDEAGRLLRLSVDLAREARDEFWKNEVRRQGRLRPLVAASVGPYGAFLADGSEYRGDYRISVKELMDFHRPRLTVLADSGADLLACETIPCRAEAEALVRLLAEFPGRPAWMSFSCADDQHVSYGERFADCVALAASSPQVVAVGVNCTAPSFIERLLQQAAAVTEKPLVAYPNSGETWDAAHHCWLEGGVPVDFSQLARRWFMAGARLIGGCCRTRPTDIRAIRTSLT